MHSSLHALLRAAAREGGARPAIRALDRAPLDYSGLLDLVDRTGATLRAAGISRGDRVALILSNGPEAATAFLSIGCAAACAPLNPAHGAAELEFFLSDLRAKTLIVERGLDTAARAVAAARNISIVELTPMRAEPAGVFALDLSAGVGRGDDSPGADDVALLLHTSGTTSRPKLVPLTHGNLCASAENIRRSLAITPGDSCLNVMPLFHIHGLSGVVLASLAGGASVICTPGFNAPRFFEWLDQAAPTWYSAVPAMHRAILARAEAYREIIRRRPIRLVRSSSATLGAALTEQLEQVFGAPVAESYSMTETAQQMAITPLPPALRKAGSPGPASGPELEIMGEAGDFLPPNKVGEIVVRGANVMKGYENNPQANERTFTRGWFRTGDLGYLDGDRHLWVTGRVKEIINRGGEKIAPREVDEVLQSHPAVAEAVTFAVASATLGESVAAAVVLQPGRSAGELELREYVAARLAHFKVPDQIIFLTEIPKSSVGKVQRIGLAEKLGVTERVRSRETGVLHAGRAGSETSESGQAGRPIYSADHRPGRSASELELTLSAIWKEVLVVPSVSPADDFLDLGGDSVLATSILARIKQTLGVDLPLVNFLEARTVSGLSEELKKSTRATPALELSATAKLFAARNSGVLSFAQERLWFLEQLGPGNPAYVVPLAIRIRGPLDVSALERALDRLVERHSILTTIYPAGRQAPGPVTPSALPKREGVLQERVLAAVHTPFDLSRGPVFRAELLAAGEEEHILLLAIHHVAFDGWSEGVLVRELARAYSEPLAPLSFTYADFAAWQRTVLDGTVLRPHVEYWKNQLAGAPHALELPADRPRPAVQTHSGARRSILIPRDVADEITRLGRAERATPFMTLLAAFQALLSRITEVEDILVGCPIAGRRWRETEDLIGVFVNTLVMRTSLAGNPSFRELLARTRATCLEAYAHQDLPFEKLVEELQPRRDLSRSPVVQIGFQERDLPHARRERAGPLSFEPFEVDRRAAPEDLVAEVQFGESGLCCTFEYNTDLFDAQTIDRLLAAYRSILEAIAADPELRVAKLPLMTKEDRERCLIEWNQTAREYPRDSTIHASFERRANERPEAIALELGGALATYRELDRRANALAHRLVEAGVGPETRVAIFARPSIELIAAMLGVLKAGGGYVPLDASSPASERLAFILEDSGAAVIVCDPSLRDALPPHRAPVLELDRGERDAPPSISVGAEQLALVLYTSGSTGRPKGIAVTHRSMIRTATVAELEVTFADRLTLTSNISFDAAQLEIWTPLLGGACLVGIDRDTLLSPRALASALRELRISMFFTTTVVFEQVARAVPGAFVGLRHVHFGGEAVDPAAVRAVLKAGPPRRLINVYGPAECTIIATSHLIEALEESATGVPIGRPMSNTEVYILDRGLEPVPIGFPGELCIGGDGVTRGYFGRPELTRERFVLFQDRLIYRTGDFARRRPDGNLEFLGRRDHQVKVRGMRVELEEIEAQLTALAYVRAAIADYDRSSGRIVAYLITGGNFSEAEARRALAAKLPEYMLPAAFVTLDQFPLTPLGKIDRRALPRVQPAAPAGAIAPRTPAEEKLAAIWSDVLGRKGLGIHDDFFELGGHSLLATRVISRISDTFGVEIPVRSVFESKTIAALALDVTTRQAASVDAGALDKLLEELEP